MDKKYPLHILIVVVLFTAIISSFCTYILLSHGETMFRNTQIVEKSGEIAIKESSNIAAAPVAPSYRTEKYTIKKGDTLIRLGSLTQEDYLSIAKRNNISNPHRIFAGQVVELRFSLNKRSEPVVAMPNASLAKTSGDPAGASQGKLSKKSHLNNTTSINCARVSKKIRDKSKKTLARAECIRKEYGAIIKEAIGSVSNEISPIDIVAIMIIESAGFPYAVSKADVPCLGLMQLQPPTARQYGLHGDIFDVRKNIFTGVRVYEDYIYHYGKGNRNFGLAAYNMGPNNKRLRISGFDPGKYRYVVDVDEVVQLLRSENFSL